MTISALALKILGGSVAAAGTVGTGYLVWDNFINTGLTEHDNLLLKKSTEFTKLTWSASSNTNSTTTTTTASENPQLKLTFSTGSGNSQTTQVSLEISNSTAEKKIFDDSKIKTWKCTISQSSTTKKNLKDDDGSEIGKLKKSFGIKTTDSQITDQNWKSIEKFIKSCAYYGGRKNLVNGDVLNREIKLKTKALGTDNMYEFVGLDKFFV